MPRTLIVAEKPSVGSDIARVLGCRDRRKGYIEGDGWIVTWAIGHLVTLCSPEEMDDSLKTWSFETLPMLPQQMKLKVVGRTREQFGTVKRLMNQADVTDIVCATDSGREGELIYRYIYKLSGCGKPFRRLWINSMTDEAIREGLDTMKPGEEYDNLYQSARCRAEADWLVGMNGSRGYTLQYDRLLSVGRVQSPTLAIIVKREREIQSFVPEQYQELWASFQGFNGRWFDEKAEERPSRIPKDRLEWARKFAEELKGKPYAIEKVQRERKSFKPPKLYDLTELQRDANRTFGWPAAKTLEIAQTLYEKRKLITYPRTDSRYITRDLYKTLKTRLAKLDVPPWEAHVKTALQSERSLFGWVVNDSQVSDHHAILPTGRDLSKVKLEEDEGKLFGLIAKRFIAIFFPDQEVEFLTVTTRADGQPFLSKGKNVLVPGWSAVYESTAEDAPKRKTKSKKDEEYEDLPNLSEGDAGKVKSAKIEDKKTSPPTRYTEASLLSAMENAGRMIEDEELREQMKDSGLGTPATRAAIIERLIQVRYVRRTGRLLAPTPKGIALVGVLVGELASPEMTGRWEKELAQIGRGEKDPEQFLEEIRGFVRKIVDASKTKVDGADFPEEKRKAPAGPKEPVGVCPACGGTLYENSKTFYCMRWRGGCKFSIWKDAASKSGGPEIDVALARKLLEGKPLHGRSGTLQLLKRTPWVEWTPRPDAEPHEPASGETDAP